MRRAGVGSLDVMDNDTLIRICVVSFFEKEIDEAMKLFLPQLKVARN